MIPRSPLTSRLLRSQPAGLKTMVLLFGAPRQGEKERGRGLSVSF